MILEWVFNPIQFEYDSGFNHILTMVITATYHTSWGDERTLAGTLAGTTVPKHPPTSQKPVDFHQNYDTFDGTYVAFHHKKPFSFVPNNVGHYVTICHHGLLYNCSLHGIFTKTFTAHVCVPHIEGLEMSSVHNPPIPFYWLVKNWISRSWIIVIPDIWRVMKGSIIPEPIINQPSFISYQLYSPLMCPINSHNLSYNRWYN